MSKFGTSKQILDLFNAQETMNLTIEGYKIYSALCPAHQDNLASLTLTDDTSKSKVIAYCHAGCLASEIFAKVNMNFKDSFYNVHKVCDYEYYTSENKLAYTITRFSNKTFPKYPKSAPTILYKLPELISSKSDTVIIVEGEKDVDNLSKFGFTVTTSTGGANRFKKEYAKYLIDKHIIIIEDDDIAGSIYRKNVIKTLKNSVKSIVYGKVPIGKDSSDYIEYLENNNKNVYDSFIKLFSTFKAEQTAKYFDDRGYIIPYELSKELVNKFDIINLDNSMFHYDQINYVQSDLDRMIRDEYKLIKIRDVKETIACIRVEAKLKEVESDPRYIKVKNGIYDINTDEFSINTQQFFITNQIPHDYNPEAFCPIMDKTLNQWANFDVKKRRLFEELFGYSLYRSSKFKKYFIIVGEKDTGKSTFLELFEDLVGVQNSHHLSLTNLTEPYQLCKLRYKLVNIGDDIGSSSLRNIELLKTISAGHPIDVREIRESTVTLRNYATLIFTCNFIPKITDIGGGHDTRQVAIPYTPKFGEINRNLKQQLTQQKSMEYLLLLALRGLKRVITNGFTMTDDIEALNNECKIRNNSVLEWINELGNIESILDRPTLDVFQEYVRFMNTIGSKSMDRHMFSKELLRNVPKLRITPTTYNKKCNIRCFKLKREL